MYGSEKVTQLRIKPFIHGRPFKNNRAFISTRSALSVSVYKHPGVYKRSALFTCILPCKAGKQYLYPVK